MVNRIDHPGEVVEYIGEGVFVEETGDALDLMASMGGPRKMILHSANITPAFFDLSTKIAGEILQKFSTYRVSLAIVGDLEPYSSPSLDAFVRESNRGGPISFAATVNEAVRRLATGS